MLAEAKLALRISADVYDREICSLIKAGARDLEIAGVVLPGTVEFTQVVDDETGTVTINDASTLADDIVIRAILTYVRLHFGSPNDYDRLERAYETQKCQLMHASEYTRYEEETESEAETGGEEGGEEP